MTEGSEYIAPDTRCPVSFAFWGRCIFDRDHLGDCCPQNGSAANAEVRRRAAREGKAA